MPLITSNMPETWQELEEMVAAILLECGMESTRTVNLKLPRGSVDVDVVAKETNDGIQNLIICECKNWRTNVPRDIVHAFRTVMNEIGANRGYIISRVGFQAGAYEAAEATNISLVTFQEFQEHYFTKWYKTRVWQIERNISNFNVYYEPLGRPGYGHLATDEERAAYDAVWEKYAYAGLIMWKFSPYGAMFGELEAPELPLSYDKIEKMGFAIPADIKDLTGYRELLERLEVIAEEGLVELRKVNPITRGMDPSEIDRDE
ncbi:restriction endonuclease [Roseibium album]|uniref:restriction endonuclease n=1 Tax=Roseibium album TaxID=311410 RepID=UPI00249265F6|nr:restriction endonuclease [Roseibium album]